MRVAESARKHGTGDDAMLHALRHTTRTIPGTNDVTLFIGGDHTGRLLEVGVKDLDTEDERIIHAMELRPAFYKFLRRGVIHMNEDTFEIADDAVADNTEDLRAVAIAADNVAAADAKLREYVAIARAHGRSWNRIAIALGVSRQAARQRFASLIDV